MLTFWLCCSWNGGGGGGGEEFIAHPSIEILDPSNQVSPAFVACCMCESVWHYLTYSVFLLLETLKYYSYLLHKHNIIIIEEDLTHVFVKISNLLIF